MKHYFRNLILLSSIFYATSGFARQGLWLAGGASYSKFGDPKPSAAKDLKHGSSYFFEVDIADVPLVAFHYAYRYNLSHGFEAALNGQPKREIDFNYSLHEIGFKGVIPLPRFDVYIGGGGLWGRSELEDEDSQIGADKKGMYGSYVHGGFNYYFSKHVGLKIAYQQNSLWTEKMKNLNNKKLKFDQTLVSFGIVVRSFGAD